MAKVKILLTGSSGLLGKALLYESRNQDCIVLPIYLSNRFFENNKWFVKVDLRNRKDLENIFSDFGPDIVIHTAAVTDVDFCEKNRDFAYDVNVGGTINLVNLAKKSKNKLVYISTDYVFDGEKGDYKETDIVNPINYYGRTKALCENVIQSSLEDFVIVRSSFFGFNPYGTKPGIEGILHQIRDVQVKLTAPYDSFFNPISANQLSRIILSLIANNAVGIFHVGSNMKISRCNFYIELAKEWGLDPSSSVFCTDFESYQKSKFARRPEDTSLNISKLSETLKITLPSVQEEIANLKMLEGDYFEYWREKRV